MVAGAECEILHEIHQRTLCAVFQSCVDIERHGYMVEHNTSNTLLVVLAKMILVVWLSSLLESFVGYASICYLLLVAVDHVTC